MSDRPDQHPIYLHNQELRSSGQQQTCKEDRLGSNFPAGNKPVNILRMQLATTK